MTVQAEIKNTTQLTLNVKFRAKSGKEAELKNILVSLLDPSRAESGCLNYDLHEDPNDDANFMFYENWINQAALDAHKATPHVMKFFNQADDLLEAPGDFSSWRIID